MRTIYLRSLIASAIRESIADGAEAVLLSGGLDSSTVASHARHLPAFTGYYEGEPYDERHYARLVGMDEHHEILIEPPHFVECFDEMLAAVTPPYAGTGMLGQFIVAREVAKRGIECIMSGEGGDELFGGYARLIITAGEPPPDGYEDYEVPSGYPTDLRAALDQDFEDLQNLLRVDDLIAGSFGIEVKTPLLHPSIVSYVEGLPAETRVNKRLLRQAMRGIVPDAILDRTDKRGFPTPFVAWAQKEPVKSFVKDRIGYLPNPEAPWHRGWWEDLLAA